MSAHRTILSIYWCWDWEADRNFRAADNPRVIFVAGRIEKPDRLSLRHWAATQANPLRMLRIATPSDAI